MLENNTISVLAKPALRNVLRNRRRSIVTFLLLAIGSFLVATFRFLSFGTHQDMIWHVVGLKTGYVEVAAFGWPESHSLERALDVPDSLLKKIKSVPEVQSIAPRIFGYGLLSYKESSKFVSIYARDWEKEKKITNLQEKIIKGRYGSAFADALIGKRLAQNLGVDVGSEISVIASQFDGSLGAVRLRICGIYVAGDLALDMSSLVISLPAGQELFALDPSPQETEERGTAYHRYTSLGLGFADYLKAKEALPKLRSLFAEPTLPSGEAPEESDIYSPVVYNWDRLNPGIVQFVLLDQISGEMMMAFLLLILIAGVYNNVQMSIQERLREFGILLCLGMRPIQLFIQIFMEIFLIILPAIATGIAGGIWLGNYWHKHPIVLSGSSAQAFLDMGFEPRMTAIVDTHELWIALALLLVPASIFIALAARRIFQLEPVEIINTL